jgi:hypothetical protein
LASNAGIIGVATLNGNGGDPLTGVESGLCVGNCSAGAAGIAACSVCP